MTITIQDKESIKENMDQWGDKEWSRVMREVTRYVPVECDATQEFFEESIATLLMNTGVNANSKKWDKWVKTIVDYMLHPNGEGIDKMLSVIRDHDIDQYNRYINALQDQGFLEAKLEYQRDARRAKAYAIKMAKERNQ